METNRCKRSDGKGWRCRRPVKDGKDTSEAHFLQSIHHKRRERLPDELLLEGARRERVKHESDSDVASRRTDGERKEVDDLLLEGAQRKKVHQDSDLGPDSDSDSDVALSRVAGKRKEAAVDVYDVPSKRLKRIVDTVKHLEHGTLKIAHASSLSTQAEAVPLNVKVGVPKVPRRIRSKNVEPLPIATVQMLPNIRANIQASTKKKILKEALSGANITASTKKKIQKKCHWCKLGSYCVLVKSRCNKHFFCQECIDKRFYCKAAIKRECPACQGTCPCKACKLEIWKESDMKVVYDVDEGEEVAILEDDKACKLEIWKESKTEVVYDVDKGEEVAILEGEKKFDKGLQLHIVRLLLPVIEKLNQEKYVELDTEAKIRGRTLGQLYVRLATPSWQQKCCFCSAWVVDIHRSCECCSYILCINCCQEFRDGFINSGFEDLKKTRMVRTKSNKKISWGFISDESIRCPPRNVGGCEISLLDLTCFSTVSWTKDLEASAKQIVCDFESEEHFEAASSPCLWCDGIDEKQSKKVGNMMENKSLYFSTNQDFQEKNLEHFMKRWGNGQPLVIRDVLQNRAELSWDFGFLLCEYLKMSSEFQKDTETQKSKNHSDWCKVQFFKEQISVGGRTHENVLQEHMKFNILLSSDSFQDVFPNHHAAVMQALPVQEYINPLTGNLNLAANLQHEAQDHKLGPNVYISFGGPENLSDADLITRLCSRAYDMLNILAHASGHPVSKKKLREVKFLMEKRSSNHETMSSTNKLQQPFGSSSVLDEEHMTSDGSDNEALDNDDFSPSNIASSSFYQEEQLVDRCGARWDVFRREDVPKLVEYLNKYSSMISKTSGSPEKVVHPLFDEMYYLDDIHILRLKEELNVVPWSFKQDIGEAVIIPAGCPYQMKKIKSCVNVVLKFFSPESALECIKMGDELRRLPVNHKAKAGMPEVKKMVITKLNSAIDDFREVSRT